jgi:heme/copper-type cytochrome/quinol oxidase subunit 3
MSDIATQHEIETGSLGVDNRKLAIWTFIASEVMFFTGLIVTYMVMRGRSTTGPYPAEVLSVPLVAINTFVLLGSSFTMVTALSAIERGDARGLRRWLSATAVLGLLFLSGQAFEFISLAREGASLSSNLFGATFFTLTGFHGMHVFVGVIWIVFVLARAFRGGVTQENHLAVELVGLYWHFVDIVWIIIFTIVYLLRA